MADDQNNINFYGLSTTGRRYPLREVAKAERSRPFTTFRFLVETMGDSGAVVGAFTGFSGIRMSNQMVQARVGNESRGVRDNFPGITEYQHVTLSKGVIGDNDFLDWMFNSVFPGAMTGPQGKNAYRNLDIVALTDTGERGVVWTLINAIPAGYQLAPMDASRSEILIEEIEFAIAGVTRTVPGKNNDSIVNYTAALPRPYNPGSYWKMDPSKVWPHNYRK